MTNHDDWVYNYFNYFTEVEEHFQRARGTGLFLLSPLDWALIESWKNAEVPLEAVLRGIDAAFEKWRGRKVKTQMVNSLAFCAQAVLIEAQIPAAGSGSHAQPKPRRETAPPFALDDLRAYLENNAASLPPEYTETAASLRKLAAEVERHYTDLEALEQRLTVLEDKMIAAARLRQSEDELLESRRRARPATTPLPRQDDRRATRDAGKAIPRAQPAGARQTTAPQLVLHALSGTGLLACPGPAGGRAYLPCIAAAMIQHNPSATAPAAIAAAVLRSSTTCFHTSNGASLIAIANAAKNASTPSEAKISAFSGGKSVMASLYE